MYLQKRQERVSSESSKKVFTSSAFLEALEGRGEQRGERRVGLCGPALGVPRRRAELEDEYAQNLCSVVGVTGCAPLLWGVCEGPMNGLES